MTERVLLVRAGDRRPGHSTPATRCLCARFTGGSGYRRGVAHSERDDPSESRSRRGIAKSRQTGRSHKSSASATSDATRRLRHTGSPGRPGGDNHPFSLSHAVTDRPRQPTSHPRQNAPMTISILQLPYGRR